MFISQVNLKGYRNFRDATIKLAEKSLIIGANDIGKTNLLYSLRILLDRSLSEADIEPKESDFYARDLTDSLEIIVEFQDVTEDCVLSRLREHVSEAGALCLGYRAHKSKSSKRITYSFYAGPTEDNLEEISSRFYLKVLHLKFIGSSRDLFAYIRKERKSLLQEAKEGRSDDEIERDDHILSEIEVALGKINDNVIQLSYIDKATEGINTELESLSFHHQNQEVVFDTGASDPSRFVDELRLSSRVEGKNVLIGGDGRNNQIHLALWSAKNKIVIKEGQDPFEVTLFCIEEPEAHLHPHQQRRLAQYLASVLNGQVLITTHSPQVVCEFPPDAIIRLYDQGNCTIAAGNGINPFSEAALIDLGYRLNIIPAESFFSDVVLLVEGPSEELFYKALSKKINVDLDRLNISILMVDGIGFKPFISLMKSLCISFVLRTDNDIIKVPHRNKYRLAGIQRAIDIYRTFYEKDEQIEGVIDEFEGFPYLENKYISEDMREIVGNVRLSLENIGIYVSDIDLEHDLQSIIPDVVRDYFGVDLPEDEIISAMQSRKATFMFDFLRNNSNSLSGIKDSLLARPLLHCQEIVEGQYELKSDC